MDTPHTIKQKILASGRLLTNNTLLHRPYKELSIGTFGGAEVAFIVATGSFDSHFLIFAASSHDNSLHCKHLGLHDGQGCCGFCYFQLWQDFVLIISDQSHTVSSLFFSVHSQYPLQ